MAVALVASSRSGVSDASGTSCTVPVPTGAASGHIALLGMKHWETFDATGITWPTGFTVIASVNGLLTGNRQKLYVAWKRLTSADTGNYVVTWTSSQWSQGHCILISGGLASGDPIETTNTANGTGTSIPSTSVTIATLAFLAHFVDSENAASETTVPTSFTKELDGDYLRINYRIPGSTGTFSAASGVLSASSAKNTALIAVKPAAAGGGPVSLDAAGTAAAGATGASSVARPIAANASASSSITAAGIVARSLTSSAGAASGATGAIIVDRGLGATSPGASGFTGALLAGGIQRDLDAAANGAAGFSGAFAAARGLAGSGDSSSGGSGDVSTARSFAGALASAGYAAADLSLVSPTWRLVMPQIVERFTMRGSLSTTCTREITVFGDENGLFTTERGSPSDGTDDYGAIPYGTRYIWLGGHVNTTDDSAIKNLWLAHGFEVEVVI